MNNQKKTSIELAVQTGRLATLAGLLMAMALVPTALASENVPHRPFAYWANVPDQGQFIAGFVYEQSEAYHMWAGGQYHNVTAHAGGESYGTDINQGYLALQYGLTERWALDFNAGYTSEGWRYFDNGDIQSTSGLMDWSFGVRYQIYNELTETNLPWAPTLTFRAGAVMPGSFSENFIFAPGSRSTAIEPELLLRKHFGWHLLEVLVLYFVIGGVSMLVEHKTMGQVAAQHWEFYAVTACLFLVFAFPGFVWRYFWRR